MKFLVLGCNGMAGHLISLYLKEKGHSVTGFARSRSKYVETIVGDATDTELLKSIIINGNYDSVINCIGLLNQFAENNKSMAVLLNGYLPHFLADITRGTDTQIIHMSTDCVFSGKRGQYTEEDECDGQLFYDKTKAIGEIEDEKNITLRQSIVGPDIKEEGIGLLNWFMKQEGSVNGYTKAMWTGQTTLQLAKTMESAAKQRAHGLFNTVPETNISKYELLRLFNRYMRNDELTVNPVEGVNADKSLKRTRFEFDCKIPDYETQVAELSEWMRAHREMYPHYKL